MSYQRNRLLLNNIPPIMIFMICLLFVPRIHALEKITLATHESPPYSGSDLINNGIITEIVSEAFRRQGYEIELEIVPWKRGLEGTKKGIYDGLFGCWYRKERETWFIYSAPLIANEIIFLKKNGSPITFDGNFESLKHYRIGYIRGYAYPPGIESVKDLLNMEMVTDNVHNLLKLAKGRLDLIMIDRLLARYIISTELKPAAGSFEEIDYILAEDANHVVFSKNAKDIETKAEAFAEGLEYIKRHGMIEEIIRKHHLSGKNEAGSCN